MSRNTHWVCCSVVASPGETEFIIQVPLADPGSEVRTDRRQRLGCFAEMLPWLSPSRGMEASCCSRLYLGLPPCKLSERSADLSVYEVGGSRAEHREARFVSVQTREFGDLKI